MLGSVGRLEEALIMKRDYTTFLCTEDWFIYAWDPDRRRVLAYNTELWGEWYHFRHGEDDPAAMAQFIDDHTPEVLSAEETARFWAEIDRAHPGIQQATLLQPR